MQWLIDLKISNEFEPTAHTSLVDDYSVLDPPDSISNSEVKRHSGDDSVGSPHVKVAHRQPPNTKNPAKAGFFFVLSFTTLTYKALHSSYRLLHV